MTILLVTGGRDYDDRKRFSAEVGQFRLRPYEDLIVNGGCPTGADFLARLYGETFFVPVLTVPADWYSSRGRASGPYRNARMLSSFGLRPDKVLAFPGGKGTASMVGLARQAGIEIVYAGRDG